MQVVIKERITINSLNVIEEQTVLGKEFKVYGTYDKPLFLAKDVAGWIELTNVTDMISRVDSDEVTKLNLGGLQGECNFLTEDGLYEVLMQSRKPIAKQFKKEVKKILKDIRRHGLYTTDELLNNPDIAIKAFTALKEEREKNKLLQQDNERMKPKEIFADAVSASNTSILIGDLAKIIKQNGVDIGQKRLFSWMREHGYLIKRKGADWNSPTQKSMEKGLFEVKETAITHSDGHVSVSKTTKVTGRGQLYFINKFVG